MAVETESSAGKATGAATRPLRVDLMTPAFWPEVRRGTERFTHELAAGLLERGHEPRILTSHRGRPAKAVEGGIEVMRVPRPPDSRLRRRMWEDHVSHVPFAYAALRVRDPHVAHAMHGPDAVAALRWKERSGRPVVFSFMGIPDHDGMFQRRKRLDFVVRALKGCDAVVSLSRAAAEAFQHWFGYASPVIEPGVNLRTFVVGAERAAEPTIICTADVGEPRKNVPLLLEAFALVRRDRPRARLVLSRPRDAAVAARVIGDAPGVELADLDDREALARAYGEAWVSVLASTGEAFGLVLLEAMACGTPVVGSRVGGIIEVVDRPEVGRLFDEFEAPALARALLEALELAPDPATRAACRARAEELSTDRTADRYLALYQELL